VTHSAGDNKCCEPCIVNIYLIYSPLHYLAAESIAVHHEPVARNVLFYLKEEFGGVVDPTRWDSSAFLPWPRFYPERGLFGRLRRATMNLEMVGSTCAGASEIRLHTPVIDTEAVNYFIQYLRRRYPTARFSVRLIPDGLLNVQRHPLGRIKELLQYCKKLRRVVCPDLDYYTFRGDRTGSDDAIVDRIYVLPGLPHEYDRSRTVEIPLMHGSTESRTLVAGNRRALVLGQPLVAYRRFTPDDMHSVSAGMRNFIADCGIDEICYKSHPRDLDREFAHPDYRELVIDGALEKHLAAEPYDLVIGVCSTALLTARMILPHSCRVVAYGLDMMKYRGERDRRNIEAPFASLGVEMVRHGAFG